jgi:hypothetical protein
MAVHASCLRGRHCGRRRAKLQGQQRQTGQRSCMHRLGNQTAPGCITSWPACVEHSMASDPNRHRVSLNPGDHSKNGRARCPSQPSPGICAPRRSPSSSRCPQRRSAAGPRRACCPTSAPWVATDATPTPRSGPCGKPCPSHPRPGSRAPRLTAPAPLLSVASVVVRDRPLLDRDRVGPGHGRLRPCERAPAPGGDLRCWPNPASDLARCRTDGDRCCP